MVKDVIMIVIDVLPRAIRIESGDTIGREFTKLYVGRPMGLLESTSITRTRCQ